MNGSKLLFFYCQFCPELGKMGFSDPVLVIDLLYHELAVGIHRYGFPGKFLCLFECGEDRVIFRSIIGGGSQGSGVFKDDLIILNEDEPVCCRPGISPRGPSVYTSRGAEGDVLGGTPDITSNEQQHEGKR